VNIRHPTAIIVSAGILIPSIGLAVLAIGVCHARVGTAAPAESYYTTIRGSPGHGVFRCPAAIADPLALGLRAGGWLIPIRIGKIEQTFGTGIDLYPFMVI